MVVFRCSIKLSGFISLLFDLSSKIQGLDFVKDVNELLNPLQTLLCHPLSLSAQHPSLCISFTFPLTFLLLTFFLPFPSFGPCHLLFSSNCDSIVFDWGKADLWMCSRCACSKTLTENRSDTPVNICAWIYESIRSLTHKVRFIINPISCN